MSFTDTKNHTWDTSVTVGSIRRVKNLSGIDLAKIFEEEVYGKLVSDPFALVDVITALVLPQIEKREMSQEDFANTFDGETIERATDSLIQSIAEFFPAPKRKPLLLVWERTLKNQEQVSTVTMQKINAVMDFQEKKIMADLEAVDPSTFGKSSGSMQDSQE